MEDTNRWTAAAAGNVAARNALLDEHMSLVHFVARKLARVLSSDADPDEMISVGALGLMAALESFDPSRGLAFSTHAVPRIRGAILDEIRKQDVVPRSVRRKRRELSCAREALMRRHFRSPRDAEIAKQVGIDVETMWRWQCDIERSQQVSLTARTTNTEDGDAFLSPIDYLQSADDQPDERVEREERLALLRRAIGELKEQQRLVLSLHYFEEHTSREIAQVLGISESRVSQIRTKALMNLRAVMSPLQASA
jgi:RNA polymerase sigma factor for flagellar operon FliA